MVKKTDSAPAKKSAAKKAAPAKKTAKKLAAKAASEPSPEAHTLRTSTVTAERVAAAGKLSKDRGDDATEALLDGALSTDEAVRVASLRAFHVQIQGRINRKKPFDLVPRFRATTAILAALEQGSWPDLATARENHASSSLLTNMINWLQNEVEARTEVREALRHLAWDHDLGSASKRARSTLVYRKDHDSIERVSHSLSDYNMRAAAAFALYSIDPAVAIPRARAQLSAARDATERNTMADALLNNARYHASAEWDSVFAPLAKEFSSLALSYAEWARGHGLPSN
jgi:hypothetical protein